MPLTIEEQAKLKKERSDRGSKLLKEKGEKMSRADKAFVKTFVKKDATVPVGSVPSKDEHEQK